MIAFWNSIINLFLDEPLSFSFIQFQNFRKLYLSNEVGPFENDLLFFELFFKEISSNKDQHGWIIIILTRLPDVHSKHVGKNFLLVLIDNLNRIHYSSIFQDLLASFKVPEDLLCGSSWFIPLSECSMILILILLLNFQLISKLFLDGSLPLLNVCHLYQFSSLLRSRSFFCIFFGASYKCDLHKLVK